MKPPPPPTTVGVRRPAGGDGCWKCGRTGISECGRTDCGNRATLTADLPGGAVPSFTGGGYVIRAHIGRE